MNIKAGTYFYIVLNLVIASALTSNNAYGSHVLIICLTLLRERDPQKCRVKIFQCSYYLDLLYNQHAYFILNFHVVFI